MVLTELVKSDLSSEPTYQEMDYARDLLRDLEAKNLLPDEMTRCNLQILEESCSAYKNAAIAFQPCLQQLNQEIIHCTQAGYLPMFTGFTESIATAEASYPKDPLSKKFFDRFINKVWQQIKAQLSIPTIQKQYQHHSFDSRSTLEFLSKLPKASYYDLQAESVPRRNSRIKSEIDNLVALFIKEECRTAECNIETLLNPFARKQEDRQLFLQSLGVDEINLTLAEQIEQCKRVISKQAKDLLTKIQLSHNNLQTLTDPLQSNAATIAAVNKLFKPVIVATPVFR